ncbi:DMT family transporter [Marinomonas sp.]
MMTKEIRLFFYIALALIAFAGNSILCRLALAEGLIDPASFTLLRLVSGAFTLLLLCLFRLAKSTNGGVKNVWQQGSWLSALALFLYALGFSYAYVSLGTGLGALILFGAVQLTLILLAIRVGQRLAGLEWLGLAVAFLSFVYLILPSLQGESTTAMPLLAVGLMVMAGIAWGAYTWLGKKSTSPLFVTTSNFIRTLPMIMIFIVFIGLEMSLSSLGAIWAILSGAVMSGLGYALWYALLPQITTTLAAVLQLLVPVIATIGGVVFASEAVTAHLILASAGVLGGVLMVILSKRKSA